MREGYPVAGAPDTLTLKTHRDLEGRRGFIWVRRALLALLALPVVLGLGNVFGQRPRTGIAAARAATLKVYAPVHARSGLIYAARFTVAARREIKNAVLVFDPGWAEGYTVNGAAPQPLTETTRDGKLAYSFGHVPAGGSLDFFLSLQVNPTNVGRRSQNVELDDGETKLAAVHRTVTIFP